VNNNLIQVYIQSHLVQQVYVDGDSLERYLIAVNHLFYYDLRSFLIQVF